MLLPADTGKLSRITRPDGLLGASTSLITPDELADTKTLVTVPAPAGMACEVVEIVWVFFDIILLNLILSVPFFGRID